MVPILELLAATIHLRFSNRLLPGQQLEALTEAYAWHAQGAGGGVQTKMPGSDVVGHLGGFSAAPKV